VDITVFVFAQIRQETELEHQQSLKLLAAMYKKLPPIASQDSIEKSECRVNHTFI
jgi:hypothetical protein